LLKIILTNTQKSSQDLPHPAATKCSGNGHGQIFPLESLTTYQKILNKLQLRVILIKIDFRFVSCFFLVSKSKSRKLTCEGKLADWIQCCINHYIRLLCCCKTPNIPSYVL